MIYIWMYSDYTRMISNYDSILSVCECNRVRTRVLWATASDEISWSPAHCCWPSGTWGTLTYREVNLPAVRLRGSRTLKTRPRASSEDILKTQSTTRSTAWIRLHTSSSKSPAEEALCCQLCVQSVKAASPFAGDDTPRWHPPCSDTFQTDAERFTASFNLTQRI